MEVIETMQTNTQKVWEEKEMIEKVDKTKIVELITENNSLNAKVLNSGNNKH